MSIPVKLSRNRDGNIVLSTARQPERRETSIEMQPLEQSLILDVPNHSQQDQLQQEIEDLSFYVRQQTHEVKHLVSTLLTLITVGFIITGGINVADLVKKFL